MLISNPSYCSHPVQNLRVLKKVGEEGKKEWAQSFITSGFKAIEQLISESSGMYCVGGNKFY